MRRFFALAAAISALALGTSASQLPLGQPHSGTGMKDPSFPQSGVMDLAGANTVVGDAGRVANLADTLTLDRKAGLWWEYARDVSSTAKLLASSGKQTTLLVPVDSAIMKMTRKPHQNEDGSQANDQQAEDNVARFIAAHIVPGDVDMPTRTAVPTLLGGLNIEISGEEGDWRVQPGDVEVLAVKSASNGKILYINQVLKA